MSFCEHCVDLKELPGKPSGTESKVAGVTTYVAKGSSDKGAIVIATDIFGLGIVNPRIVADKLAADSGLSVYVPDIFPGGSISADDFVLPKKASDGAPDEQRVSSNFDNFGKWMGKKNDPPNTYPIYQSVVAEVRKSVGKVGGIGYCYGGKLVSLASQDGTVDAGVIYHPAMLEADEPDKIKVPILLNEAELDPLFGEDLVKAWHEKLEKKNLLDKRTQQFPNTVHGFGCRPDVNDPKVKAGHDESVKNTAAFLKETLSV
jgi:dienelactone hydrolase